jgi:hypothetical protein
MFWIFRAKNTIKRMEEEVRNSFDNLKNDFSKVGEWIRHFDDKISLNSEEVRSLKEHVNRLSEDLEGIKEMVAIFGRGRPKQRQTAVDKQQVAVGVQTPVQTAVQTSILDNLTVSERALVLALLYSDLKLSYEDLAVMMGKEKSTIRGQINAIKQKSEGLIMEFTEVNGKKRVFIPEEVAQLITKNVKVKVKKKSSAI